MLRIVFFLVLPFLVLYWLDEDESVDESESELEEDESVDESESELEFSAKSFNNFMAFLFDFLILVFLAFVGSCFLLDECFLFILKNE